MEKDRADATHTLEGQTVSPASMVRELSEEEMLLIAGGIKTSGSCGNRSI